MISSLWWCWDGAGGVLVPHLFITCQIERARVQTGVERCHVATDLERAHVKATDK